EVGGGIGVSTLIAVAEAQGEPGPELAWVEGDRSAQGDLGALGSPQCQQGGPQEVVISSGAEGRARGPSPVSGRRVLPPQGRQETRPVLVERGRHPGVEMTSQLEPFDPPGIDLSTPRLRFRSLGEGDAGTDRQQDQLRELAPKGLLVVPRQVV